MSNQMRFRQPIRFGSTPYPDGLPGHTDHDTSRAAAKTVAPTLAVRQWEVLQKIARYGHTTIDLLCERMDVPPNQISGRFTELHKLGYIYATGSKRPTRTGCMAKLWSISDAGVVALGSGA